MEAPDPIHKVLEQLRSFPESEFWALSHIITATPFEWVAVFERYDDEEDKITEEEIQDILRKDLDE